MTTDIVVRVRHVSRTFGHGASAVVAVHDVSCDIARDDRIALVGPSGSGKTTLLHLIAGLDLPTVGTVGWPAIGPRELLRPGPVAIVFQTESLLPSLDVLENVMLPLLLQGEDRRSARVAAAEALSSLDLRDLGAKLPDDLSGGQAQRVAVARVLAGRPQLILADEPTGQLDHVNATLVVDALIDAARRCGAALIVNTHDPLVARRLPTHWSMHTGLLQVPTGCAVRP